MSETVAARLRGTVKFYNKYNGWGFIAAENGEDYFVHFSRIQMDGFRYLKPKEAVEFEPRSAGTKLQAHRVRRLAEVLQTPVAIARPRTLKKNPFTPQNPIVDPKQFAGREDFLVKAIQQLYDHRNVIVSGDRGVGKSSFANQLCAFMEGDVTLLEKLGFPIPKDLPSNVIVQHVCQRDTTAPDFCMGIVSACEAAFGNIRKQEKIEINLQVLKRTIEVSNPRPSDAAAYAASLITRIANNDRKPRGVTLRIDEADLVAAVDAVPGFLRSISEQTAASRVNFNIVLVGITGTLTALVGGHASTKRLFSVVHLPRMSDDEIREIVRDRLSASRTSIDDDTLNRIVHLSDGFPSPAHLLGYHAFAMDTNSQIERDDLEAGLEDLVRDLKEEGFAGLYDSATAGEYESIIQVLADPSVEALTSDEIAQRLGEARESVRARLGIMRGKGVVDVRKDSKWRLQDPLFKIYCRWVVANNLRVAS